MFMDERFRFYAPANPKYLHPCRQCRERTRLQDVIGRVEYGTEAEEVRSDDVWMSGMSGIMFHTPTVGALGDVWNKFSLIYGKLKILRRMHQESEAMMLKNNRYP